MESGRNTGVELPFLLLLFSAIGLERINWICVLTAGNFQLRLLKNTMVLIVSTFNNTTNNSMKNKDLIAELSKLDGEADIFTYGDFGYATVLCIRVDKSNDIIIDLEFEE